MLELRLKIYGDVIGVNFRYYTKLKADELGLVGWVKNTHDGAVEIVAQGDGMKLKKLLQWAKQGPKLARVDNVEVNWSEPEDAFTDFEIRFD